MSGSIILTIFGILSENLISKKRNFITFLTQNRKNKIKPYHANAVMQYIHNTHVTFSMHGEWVLIAWQYSEVVGLIKYTLCKLCIILGDTYNQSHNHLKIAKGAVSDS